MPPKTDRKGPYEHGTPAFEDFKILIKLFLFFGAGGAGAASPPAGASQSPRSSHFKH